MTSFERRGAFLELRARVLELSTSERAELAASVVLSLDALIDEDKVLLAVGLYRSVDLDQVDDEEIETLRKFGILATPDALGFLLSERDKVERLLAVPLLDDLEVDRGSLEDRIKYLDRCISAARR